MDANMALRVSTPHEVKQRTYYYVFLTTYVKGIHKIIIYKNFPPPFGRRFAARTIRGAKAVCNFDPPADGTVYAACAAAAVRTVELGPEAAPNTPAPPHLRTTPGCPWALGLPAMREPRGVRWGWMR